MVGGAEGGRNLSVASWHRVSEGGGLRGQPGRTPQAAPLGPPGLQCLPGLVAPACLSAHQAGSLTRPDIGQDCSSN